MLTVAALKDISGSSIENRFKDGGGRRGIGMDGPQCR